MRAEVSARPCPPLVPRCTLQEGGGGGVLQAPVGGNGNRRGFHGARGGVQAAACKRSAASLRGHPGGSSPLGKARPRRLVAACEGALLPGSCPSLPRPLDSQKHLPEEGPRSKLLRPAYPTRLGYSKTMPWLRKYAPGQDLQLLCSCVGRRVGVPCRIIGRKDWRHEAEGRSAGDRVWELSGRAACERCRRYGTQGMDRLKQKAVPHMCP